MHVLGFPFDLNHSLFQLIFTVFVIVVGILHLVKTTASKYFVVDANFEEGGEGRASGERERQVLQNRFQNRNQMVAVATSGDGCAVCGKDGSKKCSRCKHVRYCSTDCQTRHWREGHSKKCQELKSFGGLSGKLTTNSCGLNTSICDSKSGKEPPQLKKVLFPYEDFVKLFNWENMGFRPSGLLNCGNSCYANVVLQCLSCTRPLVAYLLEIGHEGKCKRNDWCFLCELQHHVHRARNSWQPFSPINILSRLPNIGGNLGYGKQEDAHEFMRFAIDTMQSVCLDEFGGEKALHPISQETTLIQYIFGGHLQSQVKCSKCNKISYRHENMMDLTVEIQGEAESLEECLDQFTAEEWLDGDNMYKCDGCNDYVRACKRLAIHSPPNILTIALKRFQSGRFGKLNKRVTFPETLDLGPYMSTPGYGTDVYKLYAVVVHIDMLNASYFGHYICYTKDFRGNWYRIDDCKVTNVELEEVLSQGAYMLLYSRMCARPACVKSLETCKEEKQEGIEEAQPSSQAAIENATTGPSIKSVDDVGNASTVISTPEEEKRGVDIVEKVQPCFGPHVQPTTVEDSTTSISTIPTDVRCPAMELNSEMYDLVHMDLDDPFEVNRGSTREGLTVAIADIPVESESGSLDMDADGPIENLIVTRENQLGLDLDNSESSSLNTKLDDCETKHPDATVLSLDMDADGPVENLMVTKENQPGLDFDNSESCSLDTKLDDCETKHPDATVLSPDMDADVPVENLMFTKENQPGLGFDNSESCSLDKKLVDSETKHSDATGLSLEMNADGPVENPMATKENQPGFDLDNSKSSSLSMKLDDCGSNHSDATGVSSLVTLSEASPIVEAHSTVFKVSGTVSEDGNTATGSKDSSVNQLPVDNGFASDNDIHELPETSGLNSDMEISQEGEPSSLHSLSKPKVEQENLINSGITISAAQLSKGKSCSKAKQKPLLSRGFLDKRPRCISSNKNAEVMIKPSEVGVSRKVCSNCNGFLTPIDSSVEVNSRFTGDGLVATTVEVPIHSRSGSIDLDSKGIEIHKEGLSSNGHSLISAGDKSCCNGKQGSLFAPGFLNKRTRCNSPPRDEVYPEVPVGLNSDTEMLDNIEGQGLSSKMSNDNTVVFHGALQGLAEVEFSSKGNNCNASPLENGKHNECEQIFMDEDEMIAEVGDYNGNNGCNSFDKMGNGKAVFSRGFLNKPPQRKYLKADEVSNLSEIVSSNHDKNKTPRFG